MPASLLSPVHPCLIALLVLVVVVVVVALVYCNTVRETFATETNTATTTAELVKAFMHEQDTANVDGSVLAETMDVDEVLSDYETKLDNDPNLSGLERAKVANDIDALRMGFTQHAAPVQIQSCVANDANNAYNNHATYSSFNATGRMQDVPAGLLDTPNLFTPTCKTYSNTNAAGASCNLTGKACYLDTADASIAQDVLTRLYGEEESATLLSQARPAASGNEDNDNSAQMFYKDAHGYVHLRQYKGVCSPVHLAQQQMQAQRKGHPRNTYTPVGYEDTNPCSTYQTLNADNVNGETQPFYTSSEKCGIYGGKEYIFRKDLQATVHESDKCKFPNLAVMDTQSPLYKSFVNECADNIKDVHEACQAHTKEVHPHYTQVFHYQQIELHRNVSALSKTLKTQRMVVFLDSSKAYGKPFDATSPVAGEVSQMNVSDMSATITTDEDDKTKKTILIKSLLPTLNRIEFVDEGDSTNTVQSYGYAIGGKQNAQECYIPTFGVCPQKYMQIAPFSEIDFRTSSAKCVSPTIREGVCGAINQPPCKNGYVLKNDKTKCACIKKESCTIINENPQNN